MPDTILNTFHVLSQQAFAVVIIIFILYKDTGLETPSNLAYQHTCARARIESRLALSPAL